MKRIFIVGVARSGTTLMQSILGSHSEVYSFPESHFFRQSIPKHKLLRPFHKINQDHEKYIQGFLQEIGKGKLYKPYLGSKYQLNKWTKHIISIYDAMSLSESKNIWLEKTPMHLHYIKLISANTENVHFIHMIRKPLDNIAGLYHASKKYPDSFAQNTIDKSFERYISEVQISQKYMNQKGHSIIYYEELVKDPQSTIKKLCQALSIEFQATMLDFSKTAQKVSLSNEKWKAENIQEIKLKDKTTERLNEEELVLLKLKINGVQLDILNYEDYQD